MKRAQIMLGAAVLLAGLSTPVFAEDAAARCSVHSDFNGVMRSIAGDILARAKDWLGISHIVVQDDHTGCKVYVLARNTDTCSVGQHFEGTGRLRTDFSGESYDATLSVESDKGTCR
jgi:hypothetical protein